MRPKAVPGFLLGEPLIIPTLRIAAGCQRTHTVTKQDDRESGPAFSGKGSDLMQVGQHRFFSASIHISQILLLPDAVSMASVVMDDTGKPPLAHKFHKVQIALLMLAHAMRNLEDTFHRLSLGRQRNEHLQI